MENFDEKHTENIRYENARKRIKDIKGFYTHLLVYIVINIAIFIVGTRQEGIMEGLTQLSNYSTIFFWGIGLLAHWVSVFGTGLFFGKNWEEKKIKEIMEKDKKQLWK
ncbi:2TM domain-containing protein [Christiangramia aquimixticola]|uniref:2TM domain-containing protein n=1 Tax=Christiangramia aquimixticola TaxID=1697558 RepID=UPI003AA87B98